MDDSKTNDLMDRLQKISTQEEFDDYFKLIDNEKYQSISNYFSAIIKEKNLDTSTVVADSKIDRSYGYQIINGTKTNPGRDKIIALCIALKLDFEQTQRALEIAHTGILYSRSRRDSIIIHGITTNKNIMDINTLLKQNNEQELD